MDWPWAHHRRDGDDEGRWHKEGTKISLGKGSFGIISKNGKLLLGKRADSPYQGLWCAFGGRVENGETPEEALKRELLEELGIKIINPAFIEAVVDELNWELWFYKVEKWEGEATNREEHVEIKWFNADELTDLRIIDITRKVITSYLDELI